ncbi:hypothetical protein BKA70DRAFT_1209791 [Coprinopsis sp. MPI-PUGE-AT-0042]|nr:hypothetical protein BKA70DRAFT_1209791 [Coprinopsis sp. MPI-PUGE-AT-0042]
MKGLVSYADDSDSSPSSPPSTGIQIPPNAIQGSSTSVSGPLGGPARSALDDNRSGKFKGSGKGLSGAQVLIRRQPTRPQGQGRAHLNLSEEMANSSLTSTTEPVPNSSRKRPRSRSNSRSPPPPSTSISTDPSNTASGSGGSDMDLDDSPRPANTTNGEAQEEEDEISKIRRLLRPPPISGVENWGIPDAPTGDVELGVANTIQKFFALKHPPSNGPARHFNDSLIQNRSFRNPHIYKKLVDWAGIGDEKTSNFPPDIWDASGAHGALLPEYYADNVGTWLRTMDWTAQQKSREEKRERTQTSSSSTSGYNSTRTIDFSSSTNSTSAGGGRHGHHSSSSRHGERRGDRAKGATRWG